MKTTVITRQTTQASKLKTRAMSKELEAKRPNFSLIEAKRKGKQKMITKPKEENVIVKDIYGNALSSMTMVRGETGIIYDKSMAQHRCLWDNGYPECPERFTSVLNRCEELGLLSRCKSIATRTATKEEILLKHTEEHYALLESTKNSTDEENLEDISSNYDAIYIHPTTFDLSLLAAGCTIELVDNILSNKVQNGMAIIRPPGHHAMKAEYNGYCFFNNVAVAAQHALNKRGLKRIMIVDWDVHHGQGTQRAFYDDPRVVYFSIHRYEHGQFWPNLRESDYDYIGVGKGEGYNFNIPLNKTGMTNADYLAIFQQIIMPVALEFTPELVIVSAGYDSALGDEKGEMLVSPAAYTHLLSPLLSLAQGRVAVILEGGYCLESLTEGAALTLKSLLGDPCPFMEPLEPPSDSIQESILNCIYYHKNHWDNLQFQDVYNIEQLNNINPQSNLHKIVKNFIGGDPPPEKYKTRDCYPIQSEEFKRQTHDRLMELRFFTKLNFPANRVAYVYDDALLEHENLFEIHPEQPDRIRKIRNRHNEFKLLDRMKMIKTRPATVNELTLVHDKEHVNLMKKIVKDKDLEEAGKRYDSIYFHQKTYECALLAAGSVLQIVDEVLNDGSRSGVCIVRPPGHHAESDCPHGFCIFNNVAVAAQYAVTNHDLKRVLIIDWDVHHGNGTQHIFEDNPNVLYISLHRYDNGHFFPKSTDADYTMVGSGAGEGFNVNIPWNRKGMGDMEYMTAFQNLIMPIAYEFNPELVLISAGFDAAIGDPLGGCKVSPEAYGYFTHWLSSLANGRVILCLEGGYNVNSISYAMTMCTKALLGDPLPMLQLNPRFSGCNQSCIETLRNVYNKQSNYWKSLKFNKKLPDYDVAESPSLNVVPDPIAAGEELIKQFEEQLNLSQELTDADNNKENQQQQSNQSTSAGQAEDSTDQPGPSKPVEKKQTLTEFMAENLEALNNEEMFAIVPKKSCPHLTLLKPEELAPNSIDVTKPCAECSTAVENWICLLCFETLCGRYINEHMLLHFINTEHPLTLSFSDLSVWCYKCESYIDNPILYKYKNLVHMSKFGEELVWSYGSTEDFHLQLDVDNNENNENSDNDG